MLKDFFSAILDLPVMIIGDVMIDSYIEGSVTRISPEAPVPVVAYRFRNNRLGGAANVALNIKALGAEPILVSIVGKDENATLFKQILSSEDIDNQYIIESKNRLTTVKTRVMSGTQQLLRIDEESDHDLSLMEENIIFSHVEKLIAQQRPSVIIFQDYNKGLLTLGLIERVIHLAKTYDIPTAVDPKRKHFFAYQGVTLFKPNLKEINDALQQKNIPQITDLEYVTQKLHAAMPHQNTMITLSEKGIFTFDTHGNQEIAPTRPRHIADVCGAGDTVIAVAALGLAVGLSLKDTAQLANIAGGQVCEEVGVVPIRRDKFMHEVSSI